MDLPFHKYAFIFTIVILVNWQLVPVPVVNGLECDVYWRIGDHGEPKSEPMPCNNASHVKESAEEVDKLMSIFRRRKLKIFVDHFDETRSGYEEQLKDTADKTYCVKILGRAQILPTGGASASEPSKLLSFTQVYCAFFNKTTIPGPSLTHFGTYFPIADIYQKKEAVFGFKLQIQSAQVCNEELADKCRVLPSELVQNKTKEEEKGRSSLPPKDGSKTGGNQTDIADGDKKTNRNGTLPVTPTKAPSRDNATSNGTTTTPKPTEANDSSGSVASLLGQPTGGVTTLILVMSLVLATLVIGDGVEGALESCCCG